MTGFEPVVLWCQTQNPFTIFCKNNFITIFSSAEALNLSLLQIFNKFRSKFCKNLDQFIFWLRKMSV